MRRPVLESERLRLRPGDPADVPVLRRIREEPSVRRWWNDPAEPDEIERDLRGQGGDCLLVIEAGGEVIGGIQYYEESDPDYRHAGIDVFLGAAGQGRGLGTEAVRLLAGFLVGELGHHRLVIDPAADNHAAINCYRKVGFRPVGVMRGYERGSDGTFHDGLLMDLLAPELADPA